MYWRTSSHTIMLVRQLFLMKIYHFRSQNQGNLNGPSENGSHYFFDFLACILFRMHWRTSSHNIMLVRQLFLMKIYHFRSQNQGNLNGPSENGSHYFFDFLACILFRMHWRTSSHNIMLVRQLFLMKIYHFRSQNQGNLNGPSENGSHYFLYFFAIETGALLQTGGQSGHYGTHVWINIVSDFYSVL